MAEDNSKILSWMFRVEWLPESYTYICHLSLIGELESSTQISPV